jgi:signal transduction histidine kinase
VGRLAAGIAHEINTPVQFVGDSVEFLCGAHRDLFDLVDEWRLAQAALAAGEPVPPVLERVHAAEERSDLPYLLDNVPKAFARSHEGLGRITEIVRSMKDFAHRDGREKQPVDLNRAILGTLTIARGEYKHVAELVTELGELPPVVCHRGEISQVVLNLVVNASHAVADAVGKNGGRGRITVRSRLEDDEITIEVADTGMGIPETVRARIFEPFFTTKEVGRGTGQGLAIARSVVCQHGGDLSFDTETGVGTTFRIRLPLGGAAREAA